MRNKGLNPAVLTIRGKTYSIITCITIDITKSECIAEYEIFLTYNNYIFKILFHVS